MLKSVDEKDINIELSRLIEMAYDLHKQDMDSFYYPIKVPGNANSYFWATKLIPMLF